mgnify:CR=1 FL=1
MVNPIRAIARRVIETARALRQNKAQVCRQTAAGRKGQSLIELHTVAHTYSGEVPGAVYHARWRALLVSAASSLRMLGWISIILIALAKGAMISLAALAANAQVIAVMRLVGARDSYIAQAFMRRFTLRALTGAAIGTVLGMVALLFLPSASEEGGFLTGLGLQGGHWFLLFLIPILAAVAATPPTRLAARNTLWSLT